MLTLTNVLAGDPLNRLYIDDEIQEVLDKHVQINRSETVSFSSVADERQSTNDSYALFNDELHFIGTKLGSDDTVAMHCKWDGETWTNDVSELPYIPINPKIIVYNKELHLLGGEKKGTEKYHYIWNGETWRQVLNSRNKVVSLPYKFYGGSAVVYNGLLYIIGGGPTTSTQRTVRSFNGTTWSKVTALPSGKPLVGFYLAQVAPTNVNDTSKTSVKNIQDTIRIYYQYYKSNVNPIPVYLVYNPTTKKWIDRSALIPSSISTFSSTFIDGNRLLMAANSKIWYSDIDQASDNILPLQPIGFTWGGVYMKMLFYKGSFILFEEHLVESKHYEAQYLYTLTIED